MDIQVDFDGGNIIVESVTDSDVSLAIRPDTNAEYYQWFYFKASSPVGIARTYRIFNAAGASYHRAWIGYNVLASYDEKTWFRIETRFDGSHLMWTHTATEANISFAFFVPYSASRREALLKETEAAPNVSRRVLGHSTQNRRLDLLVFGDESRTSAKKIWLVSRQHSGEPMAEYATEGFIRRLADTQDAVAQELLSQATVYVAPNLNPDGSAAGNLRANAKGVDLNRVWDAPSDDAPEIKAAVDAIAQTGVDYFIDMHGDETRPFIWIIMSPNFGGVASVDAKQEGLVNFLGEQFAELQPPPKEILEGTSAAAGMSINYISKTYGTPGWIVELPFKETPVGDTLLAEGCMKFGRAWVEGLIRIMKD
jgi:murein tripeptide amidase MpaA